MEKNKMLSMVEGGIMIALATILSYVKIFEMPQGGSITAFSMLPIILYATRWGIKKGLIVSFAYGILQFILQGGISIHIASILLDYILAFGSLGFAGLFFGDRIKAVIGGALAIFIRFAILTLSGIVLWYMYAPEGSNVILYSITYNASYMLPECIITLSALYVVYPRFEKIINNK